MKNYLILFFLLCSTSAYCQLNCKIKNNPEDGKTISCFHKNGKISTLETWDKDNRWGNFKAYDNQGRELLNYGLRKFAGHASVYVDYFPNGQIQKVEFSSAPDGGIQFYHIIHKFNEIGQQTEYYDYSQPDGHPRVFTQFDTSSIYYQKKQKDEPVYVVPAKKEFQTQLIFVNETNMNINILLKAINNKDFTWNDTIINLKKKDSINIKTYINTKGFVDIENKIQTQILKNTKRKIKIIFANPFAADVRKLYIWYVINN